MNRSIYLLASLVLSVCFVNATHAADESPLTKTNWKNKDGYDLPGEMMLVDYGAFPVTLTQRRGKLFVNRRLASTLSEENRSVIETVAGYDCDAIVEKLKQQRSKPAHIRIDIAVLRQIGNGQLTRMPVALLAPADRLLAMRGGQQILQQKQLQARIAAVQRQRLAGAATSGAVTGTTTQPSGAANFEQEGEFEGQFGDQSAPDVPGGTEN